jgi:hypothetical protein
MNYHPSSIWLHELTPSPPDYLKLPFTYSNLSSVIQPR